MRMAKLWSVSIVSTATPELPRKYKRNHQTPANYYHSHTSLRFEGLQTFKELFQHLLFRSVRAPMMIRAETEVNVSDGRAGRETLG